MNAPGLLGGRYELSGVLGFGGMAEVRDGWDNHLSRPVAIKLLHPGPRSHADICERFQVEARAAAALNHPNIVGVYDFGDEDGMPFIVMERLPGDTLGRPDRARPAVGDRCVRGAARACLPRLPRRTRRGCCTATSSRATSC